jgi:septum formation protein
MTQPAFVTLQDSDLILASASVTRAKLLGDAGLKFYQYSVAIDEAAVRAAGIAEGILASDIAVMLAEMKATAATQRLALEHPLPPAYILGCDQILVCDEKIYSKPKDIKEARSQLLALTGKTHQLLTAVVLFQHGERIWHHLSMADMIMRQFDNEFINAYLTKLGDAALFSPGSYQIESIGIQLFSEIKGCHYSILGIPLLEVMGILREHGLVPIKNKSLGESE